MSEKEHLCGHEWVDVSIHESPPRRRVRCLHCGIEGVEAKPYGLTLSEKTIDCLRLCALPIMERDAMLDRLEKKWSLKAVYTTIENHGALFDWGTSCRSAWLTEEGNSALADVDPAHEFMRGRYGSSEFVEHHSSSLPE